MLSYFKVRENVHVLETAIVTEELERVAATKYTFIDQGELTDVNSETEVSSAHRRRGIGSGLVALTDDVIMYGIYLIPGIQDTVVQASFVDAAEGDGIQREGKIIGREGWTGQQLAKLGFKFLDLRNWDNQPVWTKTYHTPHWQAI